MTQKKPNFQDLWQITHTRKGEWVDETSKEVHVWSFYVNYKL